MNAIVEHKSGGALAQAQSSGRMAVADIISHVAVVQEVMRAVMKKDVHYGIIPGTKMPTLYKAGAEVLSMVFRIADTYEVTDMSTAEAIRYRVTCTGTHQVNGVVLGAGMGECSSGEEKYKWRKAFEPEFGNTPENMKRVKYGNGFQILQVRTEPADLANTILKMANKRAKMAMVLNVTAASDCFSQDLEDMDAAMVDHLSRHVEEGATAKAAEAATWPDDAFAKRLAGWREAIAKGKKVDDVISFALSKGSLTEAQMSTIKAIPAELVKAAGQRKPEPQTGVSNDDAIVMTYAQVAEKLNAAANIDKLDEAASLISTVADAQQRDELNALYERRQSEFNA